MEANPVNLIEDYQAHPLISQAKNFAFSEKEGGLHPRQIKAEFVEGLNEGFCVLPGRPHKNVEIAVYRTWPWEATA